MTLYKAFSVDWSLLINNYDYAAQQCVEDDNLEVAVSYN